MFLCFIEKYSPHYEVENVWIHQLSSWRCSVELLNPLVVPWWTIGRVTWKLKQYTTQLTNIIFWNVKEVPSHLLFHLCGLIGRVGWKKKVKKVWLLLKYTENCIWLFFVVSDWYFTMCHNTSLQNLLLQKIVYCILKMYLKIVFERCTSMVFQILRWFLFILNAQ